MVKINVGLRLRAVLTSRGRSIYLRRDLGFRVVKFPDQVFRDLGPPPIRSMDRPHVLVQVGQDLVADCALLSHTLVDHRYVGLQAGPSCEDLATIRTRVAEVFNALVDYLDMAVKVTFLAEDFIALGTCRGLVYLYV